MRQGAHVKTLDLEILSAHLKTIVMGFKAIRMLTKLFFATTTHRVVNWLETQFKL